MVALMTTSSAWALNCTVTHKEKKDVPLSLYNDRSYPDYYVKLDGYNVEVMIIKSVLVLSIADFNESGFSTRQTIYGYKESNDLRFEQTLFTPNGPYILYCK